MGGGNPWLAKMTIHGSKSLTYLSKIIIPSWCDGRLLQIFGSYLRQAATKYQISLSWINLIQLFNKKFDGFWFFFSYTELKQIQSGADSEHISIVHDTNPFFFYKSSLSDNNLSIYLFSHKKSPTLKNPKELILWFVTIIVRLDTLTKSSSRRLNLNKAPR